MPETQLRTKLFIPPLRPNLVPRPRLFQRLEEGIRSAKLTLISAPAVVISRQTAPSETSDIISRDIGTAMTRVTIVFCDNPLAQYNLVIEKGQFMSVTASAYKRTTRSMGGLLAVASLLVLIIGTSAFFLPTRTDVYFSWTIGSPLTAAFLGGSYLAAFVLELLAAWERVWAYARVAVPAVFLFTTITLIVTLLHLDKFHFDSPHWNTVAGTWVWLLVYLLVPFAMAAVWIMQSRLEGGDPPRSAPLAGWARYTLLVQGLVMVLTGVLLLLLPMKMATVWPWPLTALTGRAVGAWGVGLGTAALHMALENDWRRGRAGYLASAVFALLQLVNLVRFGDEFAWGSVSGVLYLVLLLSFGALGFTGWLRSRVR